MAPDVSSASYESGRRALQLAAAGDSSSIEEIASLLIQEAKEHCNSSCLDDAGGYGTISCPHHTALEVAASAGDAGAVERLLAAGADPNAPIHELGVSALEAAAARGQLVVVEKLLGAGARPDQRGRCSKTTPLIAATMAGHVNICEALVQSGADVTVFKLKPGWEDWGRPEVTAIEIAGEASNTAILELFLRVVEDKAQEFDADELESAISEGRQEASRRLLGDQKFLKRAQAGINRALDAVAAKGNTPALQRLLDAGADITDAGVDRRACEYPSAIAAAAAGGHLELVSRLLEVASDRDMLPRDAATDALQSAVSKGHRALCEPLIVKGADAKEIDIRRAALEGYLDVLEFMLQSGSDADGVFSPRRPGMHDPGVGNLTALQLAACHGHTAVVDLLLENGAGTDKYDDWSGAGEGPTALCLAISGGHSAVTERLVAAGADVNAAWEGADTPLQAAVRMGDTAALELLLAAGANVEMGVTERGKGGDDQDKYKTALSVAAEVGNLDLVRRLLSMLSCDRVQSDIPWALLEGIKNNHADITRTLLQTHPDVNKRPGGEETEGREAGLTFLQTAAANGSLEILEMLLAEGADPNLNFSRGWHQTALQSASERGELAAVKLLLAAGADVNVTGSTAPPILLAARGNHVHVFECLLAAGADIYATSYRGQTLSEAAEESGGADILDRVQAALNSRPPPPPETDQLVDGGTGVLCEACQLMPFLELIRSWDEKFELHPSLTAFRTSVAAGCPFCCFLWKRLGTKAVSAKIPQPSPVVLSAHFSTGRMCCDITEPFPVDEESAASLWGELYFSPSSYNENEGQVPITEDTSSPETFRQINAWMNTCQKEHPWCRAPQGDPLLPTRLISLGNSSNHPLGSILQPRLVHTDSMESSELKYIALSYRWPQDFPAEAKLSRDNLRDQMEGLDTSKLPQIFNDVFQVAVRMSIKYVWIDSLCIIQDDTEDWNREAALMAQIYRYAEFTVAADIPPINPDLGLFRHGDPSDCLSVTLPGIQPDWADQELVFMKPQEVAYRESPLVSRGWCFQERQISRRIVHYTENQVLWECRALQASESSPYCRPGADGWDLRILDKGYDYFGDDRSYKGWHHAVQDYSARSLTVFTDKLPALSGLAATVRDYQPADCRYLAGLWGHTFLEDLQWCSLNDDQGPTTNTRYPEYVAPTWSWASVAGRVSFHFAPNNRRTTEDHDPDPNYTLKVLEVCVQPSAGDPYGAVRHAVLSCTAGLVAALLRRKPGQDPEYSLESLDGLGVGEVYLDVDPQRYDGAEVEVLFCVHLGGSSTQDSLFCKSQGPGLALLPTGNRENEYRRVGLIPELSFVGFCDDSIKEITII